MPATAPSFTAYELELKSYTESEDHLAERDPEPRSRSQTLVYHVENATWWIKVTFRGYVSHLVDDTEFITPTTKGQRREEYQDFIKSIDFDSLPLLEDTVTEVLLENSRAGTNFVKIRTEIGRNTNRFTKLAQGLRYHIQEDPARIIYPTSLEFLGFRTVNVTDLKVEFEIADGVYQVTYMNDIHILKVVNRPLYHPRDTDVIRKELENLKMFQGLSGIVQATGIAVFTNPYATSKASDQPLVVNGILLEFYSGGSLQKVLADHHLDDYPWERWPIQVGQALSHLHEAKKTHMDIKPSNVVLNANGDAVLIDISGIGGVTRPWLAPEIKDKPSPFDLPFDMRQMNDLWAFGKLLSEIVLHARYSAFRESLKRISSDLMKPYILHRLNLPEAISRLNEAI